MAVYSYLTKARSLLVELSIPGGLSGTGSLATQLVKNVSSAGKVKWLLGSEMKPNKTGMNLAGWLVGFMNVVSCFCRR
jgi:hypothetical protein